VSTDGEWQVHEESLPLLSATYGKGRVTMVAMGLKDGGLVVVSPGKRGDDARKNLEKWGRPRFLLAPNSFHNAGLGEWKQAYPDAQVVAHPKCHARLAKQAPDAGAIVDTGPLAAALPDGARVFGPPMAKQGETWVAVERGDLRAIVVCDAVINMNKVAFAFQVLGFRARLMQNPFFKTLFLTDRRAYKAWMLDELRAHPPNLFIPSHGDPLRGDHVAADLERAIENG